MNGNRRDTLIALNTVEATLLLGLSAAVALALYRQQRMLRTLTDLVEVVETDTRKTRKIWEAA